MRDVYLCYDPISSGYIGILPEGPITILVEVRLGVWCTRTGIFQTGSATAGIRAGKYTLDSTTNFRKVLNKRCARQSVYKTMWD